MPFKTSYKRCVSGNFSTIAAVSILPILLCIGAALDFARLANMKANLQDSIDSAALGGAVAYMQGDSQKMKAQGAEIFNANATRYENLTNKEFWIEKQDGDFVYAEATAKLKPVFMDAFGFQNMNLKVSSSASIGRTVGAEVAIAIDTTNSMAFGTSWNDTMGTIEKIMEDMQEFTGNDNFYVTLVPFQDRVNIGKSRDGWVKRGHIKNATDSFDDDWDDEWDEDDWDGSDWKSDWDGCVEPRQEQIGTFQWMLDDDKPTSSDKFLPTHEDAELSDGRNLKCPDVPITGPTNDINKVIAATKLLKKGGTGRYDDGLAWAWRALSPNWRGQWGVSNYPSKLAKDSHSEEDKRNIRKKYIVYMTDGRSNAFKLEGPKEESWGWNNGSKKAFEHIAQLCEDIKANNVEIYMLHIPGNDNSTPYFKACASTPAHYQVIDSVEDVSFAFNKIKLSLYEQVRTLN